MKYIVGDNHAKKAYLELQDFKKLQYDNINKNVENDDNITRCRIFENSRSVSRLTTVNGINSRNYVKIYNVSDNKYNYCNIKVLCNDIMIYNGVYVNSLIVPIHVIGEVVIKIELNSDSEILYDLMVDFVGFSNNNSEDVIVSEIDEKVYCVYRGIGDTLVFVYNSYSDFLSKNYSNYYNIPMLLLDAKSIIDTNLFVGKTHVVLGLNASGDVVYVNSSDNYQSSTIVTSNNVKCAVLSNNRNVLGVFYINSNNSLIYYRLSSGVWSTMHITWAVGKNPILRSCQKCGDMVYDEIIAVSGNSGQRYILMMDVVHTNTRMYSLLLGKVDNIQLYIVDNQCYCCVSNESATTKKSMNVTSSSIVLTDMHVYSPCSGAVILSHGQLLENNGCFTG
ncbi:MAG: hypothetical protein E7361_00270 [Clostridiales bacterium]|nr:hypothetical protein [Clostridiales bacterium]